jgi:hypothetical protein
MDLSPEDIEEITRRVEELERLDPADLPEPAAELVSLLNRLLEEGEES